MNPKPAIPSTIGPLSRETGMVADPLRGYARQGLLSAPQRRLSGYREYDGAAVRRVRLARGARAPGFTLEPIARLLRLQDDREHGVAGIRRQAQSRLGGLNARIAWMTVMGGEPVVLAAACPGAGAPEACPILERIHADGACHHGGRAMP